MNGIGDVRLQLLAEELIAGQQPRVYGEPPGMGLLSLMLHRWRTRKALLALSDEHLQDIGISRQIAEAEGCKPFWQR